MPSAQVTPSKEIRTGFIFSEIIARKVESGNYNLVSQGFAIVFFYFLGGFRVIHD